MPQGGQTLINHRPCPAQFVAAWGASTDRVGPPHGTVHRYHQFPVPNDHHQEEPINAREHPMLLTAPPAPDSTQLRAILVEDRVIRGPGPPGLDAGLRRPAGLGADRGRGVPERYDGGAVWFWLVFSRIFWSGT